MSKKRKEKDYVVGLITGKFTNREVNGKVEQVFEPMLENKYPPLSYLRRTTDLSEDDLAVMEGLRAPKLVLHKEEFQKNNRVRRYLKFLKKENKKAVRKAGFNPNTRLNPTEPVIIKKG